MRLALLISLVCVSMAIGLEGPDFMLIGEQFMPDYKSFNLICPYDSMSRIKATAQHGFLYGIKSLNWTYVSSKCNLRSYSAAIGFRSYGIEELYMSSWYFLSLRKTVFHKLSFGLGYSRVETTYGNNLFKDSDDFAFLNISAKFNDFALAAQISNWALNDKRETYHDSPEYAASCSWQADSSLSVSCVIFNDKCDHNRLMVGQNLAVHKSLNLIAGIVSGPEIYYAGLEIICKRLVFGYNYYAVGGLDDCSKLSISYR